MAQSSPVKVNAGVNNTFFKQINQKFWKTKLLCKLMGFWLKLLIQYFSNQLEAFHIKKSLRKFKKANKK